MVGYGNIGRFTIDAVRSAGDMELAGVVRRDPGAPAEGLENVKVTGNISELGDVDVAILATPSRSVEAFAKDILAKGINTVDSFDIHSQIPELRKSLASVAQEHGAVAVISAGWDPGTDSMMRAMMLAMAPKGITYTNFGPGMSMGHTVAVKAIKGVKNALSMTIPLGTGIHRRMVYVELLPDADEATVAAAIKADPYFASDETHVIAVESVDALKDMGHGVEMIRKGVSGKTHDQIIEFSMHINNPALTGQILVAAARASMRLAPGCYTMIEIPPVDLLEGDRDALVKALV